MKVNQGMETAEVKLETRKLFSVIFINELLVQLEQSIAYTLSAKSKGTVWKRLFTHPTPTKNEPLYFHVLMT
jgi:hypothetical protein